jgi:hypothetical protein
LNIRISYPRFSAVSIFAVAVDLSSALSGNRCRGRKKAFAMSVGTMALPMTAAIRYEYCF